jgi:hypothetical protein
MHMSIIFQNSTKHQGKGASTFLGDDFVFRQGSRVRDEKSGLKWPRSSEHKDDAV